MQILLFSLITLLVIFIWIGQRRNTIICFAITLLTAVGTFLSHATSDLYLQL